MNLKVMVHNGIAVSELHTTLWLLPTLWSRCQNLPVVIRNNAMLLCLSTMTYNNFFELREEGST